MPKPKSKSQLLEASQTNYKSLMDLVCSYSEEEIEKEFPEGTINRNIRDVLAHIHHWHVMFLGWYEVGMKGAKPDMPAKGYSWQTLPDLNRVIRKEYEDVEFSTAKELLEKSYTDVLKIINQHSNEELFEKKRYKWTGSTSLGVYLISNASSHYSWGIKLIKRMNKK